MDDKKVKAELIPATEEAKEISSSVAKIEIQNQEDLEFWADALSEVKGRWKSIDAREKDITKPINDALKKIREHFKAPKRYLEDAELKIKGAISSFTLAESARNLALAKQAADAYQAGDIDGVSEATSQLAHTRGVTGLKTYQKWAFEIVDPSALPREFMMPNETLIKEHASHSTGTNEPTPIPGVRFYPTVVVASSSK